MSAPSRLNPRTGLRDLAPPNRPGPAAHVDPRCEPGARRRIRSPPSGSPPNARSSVTCRSTRPYSEAPRTTRSRTMGTASGTHTIPDKPTRGMVDNNQAASDRDPEPAIRPARVPDPAGSAASSTDRTAPTVPPEPVGPAPTGGPESRRSDTRPPQARSLIAMEARRLSRPTWPPARPGRHLTPSRAAADPGGRAGGRRTDRRNLVIFRYYA